jgi:HEPN domain-containing protein
MGAMSSPWRVFTWHPKWREADRSTDAPRPLDADALLVAQRRQPPVPGAGPPRTTAEVRALRKAQHTERKHEPTVPDLVAYADVSYLAARILLLSSEAVHHEALYCVGQTTEKYLKAVWLVMAGSPAPAGHDLSLLALQLAETYSELPEFGDSELIKLCEHLQPFEEAGRYPDHRLDAWEFNPELLTFLDGFVGHCRTLIIRLRGPLPFDYVEALLGQPVGTNPVMAAAVTAVRDNHRYLHG